MNKQELIEHINNTLFDNLKDTLFIEPTFSITEPAKSLKKRGSRKCSTVHCLKLKRWKNE